MTESARAAVLVAPFDLRVESFPMPSALEPGAVLVKMLASGICGTDKHTYRGETEQYAGTDHASSTPFPIIQGHENVGVIAEIGDGGATAFDGSPLAIGDRVVPAPNRACGTCRYCLEEFPYYFCRNLENYGNSLSCAESPHLFGGFADYLYLRPRTPVFKVPEALPDDVAVLTELFAVTHSLDLASRMPRPSGFRPGDTVAVVGVGPVGLVHAAKAALLGASRVIAIDRFVGRLDIAADLGATDCLQASDDPQQTRSAVDAIVPDGVDVVVDATGHPDSFTPAIGLLRDGGTLLEVGAFVDLGPVDLNPADLLGRNLTLVGVAGEDARAYDATLAMLAEHHATVPFHRAVTHHFPVAAAHEAMQTALAAGDAMKVVITPD
ncbi:MAG: alcohol dehydrogenase catalytic domain-containing protein [Acidimicrobiia bacterium]|nr:alcohol dehydrogenase catalytic domain-containing protein [Acidimicrobiia bacterium]